MNGSTSVHGSARHTYRRMSTREHGEAKNLEAKNLRQPTLKWAEQDTSERARDAPLRLRTRRTESAEEQTKRRSNETGLDQNKKRSANRVKLGRVVVAEIVDGQRPRGKRAAVEAEQEAGHQRPARACEIQDRRRFQHVQIKTKQEKRGNDASMQASKQHSE